MTLTTSLLYLLLLYAVLDPDNKLSLSTGILIGAVILLFNCFRNQCNNNRRPIGTPSSIFGDLNF